MEAGEKDCEEDTLQTAFKKLRVDPESPPATVSVSEALTPRITSRVCPELSGAKPKLSCPKENWHGCMRKSTRGVVRSQRRRRSKSPILHPPKFTYCSSKMSPPAGQLKHQRLAVDLDTCNPSPLCGGPPRKDQLQLSSGHIPSPVFGASGYEPNPHNTSATASSDESSTTRLEGSPKQAPSDEEKSPDTGICPGAKPAAEAGDAAASASDFQALSKLQDSVGGRSCPCTRDKGVCSGQCPGWPAVEVYSFTGLRDVISECERNLVSPEDAAAQGNASLYHRTHPTGSTSPITTTMTSSGSPRSCSEQARAYVDDITIEDLSGYMEYYLYIPKKMSHMAEMMYT